MATLEDRLRVACGFLIGPWRISPQEHRVSSACNWKKSVWDNPHMGGVLGFFVAATKSVVPSAGNPRENLRRAEA
jgi:hypothetical protein